MTGPALGSLGFILGTLLNLYAMVVALRFVMQAVGADYYNPIAQFVVKVTDPLLVPLRRVVPSVKGLDTASLLLAFLVLLVKLLAFKALSLGGAPAIGSILNTAVIGTPVLVYLAAIDLLHLLFNIFIFAIFIQALLSWLPNGGSNPAAGLLERITAPVLTPVRKVIPPLGGLDLSALAALIGLYAARMFIVGVLMGFVPG